MNFSSNWKGVCGPDKSLAIWTGSTFGYCFALVAFTFPSHILALLISAYYLGRYPKRDNVHEYANDALNLARIPFPKKTSYLFQIVIVVVLSLPLLKLSVSAIIIGQIDYFVEDAMFMLIFCLWAMNLAYLRRLHISKYALVPGLLPITFCAAIVFIAQFPVIFSFDNDLNYAISSSLDFIFLVVYQFLVFVAICGFVSIVSLLKRNIYRAYPSVDQRSLLINSGTTVNYGSTSLPSKRSKFSIGRLIFWDAFPLLRFGRKFGLVSVDSLVELPKMLSISNLLRNFLSTVEKNVSRIVLVDDASNGCFHGREYLDERYRHLSLLKALLNTFGCKYFAVGILRFLSDASAFATPFLLGQLITFVSDATEPLSHGILLAVGLFLTSLFSALTNCWFTYLIQYMTMQVRSTLISAIFAKTLVTPLSVLNTEFNAGQLVTFLSTDSDRAANMLPSFHSVWSLPFQIGIAFYLLYAQIGLYFFAGVVLAIVMIPLNFVVCRKIMHLTQEMLAAKDDRVKVCSEVLQGMKAIKLYAWESIFKSKIVAIRAIELWRCLKGRKLLDAVCVYLWATTPILMQLSTFILFYLLSGQNLTSSRVYTSIAIFNMLIAPLNAFPWVVNGVIDGIVSLRRLQRLFCLVQFRADSRRRRDGPLIPRLKYFCSSPHSSVTENVAVQFMPPATFCYPSKNTPSNAAVEAFKFRITSELSMKTGSLVCVIGQLGSGKSAFLLSLAGELLRESGGVFVHGAEHRGVGFAPQQPWVFGGTIRNNIICGRIFNKTRYDIVIDATALRTDLLQLSSGDRTDVGEDGTTLSGGQRQRVSLARAVYDPGHSIYLLDDPISSVDAKVGRHIFSQCIQQLLVEEQSATVVMTTNRFDIASRSNLVICLGEDGLIKDVGSPADVLGCNFVSESSVVVDSFSELPTSEPSLTKTENKTTDGEAEEEEETSQVGTVKLFIWKAYAKAAGYGWVSFALITLVLMQASRNAADIWLAHWLGNTGVNSTGNSTAPRNETDFYLAVYGAIGGANSLFALLRAFSFAYVGLYAAGVLHENLLGAVLNAPLSFFESTPIGRILNRFTADVWACDDSVPFELNILLAQSIGLIGTLATIIYAAPITLAAVAPLAILYFFLQRFYRFSSRDLKRLQMTSQSPIYSHATSHALTGSSLSVIRCLGLENAVLEANMRLVDANQRVQFSSLLASQWLSTLLQLMGVVAVGACCAAAILEHWQGSSDAALVGLSLSYALSLTGFLSGLISSFTETERQMISVERVKQYIDGLPREYDSCSGGTGQVTGGKKDGLVLSFNNVWMRYRESANWALRGISLSVKSGERVAICGRTGAGKSSLFASLFRLVNIDRGSIEANGIDTRMLTRQQLRSLLASVPQEPIVFSGSIRFNLDPGNNLSDQVLLDSVRLAQLTSVLHRISSSSSSQLTASHLNVDIGERGARLSLGERQLLCVARALASSTAVVLCADEPTASVDAATEALVIKALCSGVVSQASSTTSGPRALLMIAHRLSNVLDDNAFDKIIVIDNGVVLESGHPQTLLANPESALSQLVLSSSENEK